VAAEFLAAGAVLVDSGRSALQMAIGIAMPQPAARRIVALPAFQCFEVATAAVGADCDIALYDIDPATLAPDLESLERALRLGASAVVIAPLYGLPVNWDAITGLTSRYGTMAIEDAAQANGAEWNGRPVGSLGELSIVSFGRGKGWTGGGGGALLFRGKTAIALSGVRSQVAEVSLKRETRAVAATLLQLLFGRAILYGIPASIPSLGLGETHYHPPSPITNTAVFSAALMRRTLGAARREWAIRRQNAAQWHNDVGRELLKGVPAVLSGGTAGYLRFPMRVRAEAARDAATIAARRAGIARSYPIPLGNLPAVAPRLVEPGTRFPGAEALARELVTLPTHSRLTARDRDVILALCAGWTSTCAAL